MIVKRHGVQQIIISKCYRDSEQSDLLKIS